MAGEEARREVERLTREGLGEGYRLALEARNVTKSRYEDATIVIVILAMFTWLALLLALSAPLYERFGSAIYALTASSALTVAAAAPFWLINKRHFDRRLAELDSWLDRLRCPVAPGRDDAASVFDLLVETSQQVPKWLEIKKKDRFRNHPFLNTAIMIGTTGLIYSTYRAFEHWGQGSALYLLLLAVPFLLLLIGASWAEASAMRRERDATLAGWKQRMESSHQAMEEILGGL